MIIQRDPHPYAAITAAVLSLSASGHPAMAAVAKIVSDAGQYVGALYVCSVP